MAGPMTKGWERGPRLYRLLLIYKLNHALSSTTVNPFTAAIEKG